MTLDETQREAWRRKQQQQRATDPQMPGSAGGGGGFDGLQARVAKIEAHLEHLRADLDKLRDVPVKLAVLEERVTHLPTKGWMVASLGTTLTIIAALIAFSEKVHSLMQ